MRLRIASWNVNSVRPRVEQVARFVREQAPDVLCLQEIKCQAGEFPKAAFRLGAPAAMVHDDVRAWERPSDHAPISVDLAL